MGYVAWVEGEWMGEFDDVEAALAEAAVASLQRHADVVIEDAAGAELVVRVERRATGGGHDD